MATNRILQLLRSKSLYESLDAAKIAIRNINTASDGEVRLARYQTSEGVKSLLCVYHTNENFDPALAGTETNMPGWTFIEDASSNAGTTEALQAEVNRVEAAVGLTEAGNYQTNASGDTAQVMTGAQTGGTAPSTVMGAVENVATYITTLNKAADVQNGQVVTTVTQTNGQVTETKANVKDLQLGGYAKDANAVLPIASADTVNAAFSKVENAIAKNEVASADASVTITQPSTGTSAGKTDLAVNVDGTTIVKDSSTGAISSDLKLASVTASSTNVKEEYALVYGNSTTPIGSTIKIYKDSALQEVYLGADTDSVDASTGVVTKNTVTDPQSMNFVYQLADGTYSMTKIDVSNFLTESEFGNGLVVNNGVVSVQPYDGITVDANGVGVKVGNGLEIDSTSKAVNVKIDSNNDTNRYLSVSAAGVALNGNAIDDAIENAATTLTEVAAVTETTADGNSFIKVVKTVENDGHSNYTVSTQGINDAIAVETARAENAEQAIDTAVGLAKAASGEGRTYTSQVTVRSGETTPTTVAGDIDLLDAHVEALNSSAVKSVNGSNAININTTSPADAQNPIVELKLSAAANNATDAAYAGASENNGNILQIKSDGLYLDSTWDCGVY